MIQLCLHVQSDSLYHGKLTSQGIALDTKGIALDTKGIALLSNAGREQVPSAKAVPT